MIEDTLAKIEARLKGAEVLTAKKRAELQSLVNRLRAEIGGLSKTHAEHAESIAGYTELSTREATRTKPNPRLVKHSLDGLSSSVEEFETSHPKLVEVVNSISQMLSNVGI